MRIYSRLGVLNLQTKALVTCELLYRHLIPIIKTTYIPQIYH